MKAIVATDQAAEAAGITLAERPEPTPAINDVVVEVHASGFVPAEWEWPSTWVDRSGHDRAPAIIGHECAGVVTSIGYLQLFAGIAVWVRLRRAWPFATTAAVVAAETVQYFAGLEGALWLHIPLGVMTVAALVVQFIDVWRRPLPRKGAENA